MPMLYVAAYTTGSGGAIKYATITTGDDGIQTCPGPFLLYN